jgi:putative peptidoglycan lipid II flippase
VKQVFVLMVPVMLGIGLINFNTLIGTFFASRYIDPKLAPSAIDAAFRIYMVPQGMFSVAVATVLFPALARHAARSDLDGFRNTVSLGLRQIGFTLIPAAAASMVLAEPIVRILYQRGEFTSDQTPVVAAALAAFSIGLVFNGMMLMLNRGFFGLQMPRVPTAIAAANLVLNTILFAAFYRVGTWGIPLAISLANIAGSAALFVALRRRIGGIDLRSIVDSLALITLASLALAAVAFPVWWSLDRALGREFVGQLVSLSLGLAAGGAAYLLACRVLGVREMQALLSLRARFKRP